jgi:hypothetical protein
MSQRDERCNDDDEEEENEEVDNADNNNGHADNCVNNNNIEGEHLQSKEDDDNNEHNSDNDNELNIACLKQRASLNQTTHSNINNINNNSSIKHNRVNSQPNDIIPQTVLSELK